MQANLLLEYILIIAGEVIVGLAVIFLVVPKEYRKTMAMIVAALIIRTLIQIIMGY